MTLEEVTGKYFNAQTEQNAILRLLQDELRAAQKENEELKKKLEEATKTDPVPAG